MNDLVMKIATYNVANGLLEECAIRNFSSETCGERGPGLLPKILQPILQRMHVSYELVPAVKTYSGKCYNNGSWLPEYSFFGKLANGSYDMIVEPLYFTNVEEEANCLDRSIPVLQTELTFFGWKSKVDIFSNFSLIFAPFDKYVWFCIISLILFNYALSILWKKKTLSMTLTKQKDNFKLISIILSVTFLLFAELFGSFILAKILVPQGYFIKDTREMIQRIRDGNLKLIVTRPEYVDQLVQFSDNQIIADLLKVLKENPAVVTSKEKYYNMLMSRDYVGYTYSTNRQKFRAETNCTVDIIGNPVSMPKAQAYFLFQKHSKWIDPFNKAMKYYRAWAQLQFTKHIRDIWLMTELRCFDTERTMKSTILKPLSLVSVSGAFIILLSSFLAALVVFIVERYVRGNRERPLRRETRNDMKKYKETLFDYVKRLENCDADEKLMDFVQELGAIHKSFVNNE